MVSLLTEIKISDGICLNWAPVQFAENVQKLAVANELAKYIEEK